ncbi:MAG: Hpt domain-containing protein, partial [Bacilli bacterium]|nr:Hpt domain-containing protein [Bacilli bacterium]
EPKSEESTEEKKEETSEVKEEPKSEESTEEKKEEVSEVKEEPKSEESTEEKKEETSEVKEEPKSEESTEEKKEEVSEVKEEPKSEESTEEKKEEVSEVKEETKSEEPAEEKKEEVSEVKEETKSEESTEEKKEESTGDLTAEQEKFLRDKGVDMDKSLEFLIDMEMYNMTIVDFLDTIDEKWNHIKQYKEENDMPKYAIEVHSLKSDCKYLGFMKLADVSYEHEIKSKENNSEFVNENFDRLVKEYEAAMAIIKEYAEKYDIKS